MSRGHTADEQEGAEDVFRLPRFFAFWSAETVSGFGTYITILAVQTVVVLLLGGTAMDVGLVNAAGLLPNLLGPLAGAIVERFRRARVLVATDIGNGSVLCLLPLLWTIGRLNTPTLMVIMFSSGVLTVLNNAGQYLLLDYDQLAQERASLLQAGPGFKEAELQDQQPAALGAVPLSSSAAAGSAATGAAAGASGGAGVSGDGAGDGSAGGSGGAGGAAPQGSVKAAQGWYSDTLSLLVTVDH